MQKKMVEQYQAQITTLEGKLVEETLYNQRFNGFLNEFFDQKESVEEKF